MSHWEILPGEAHFFHSLEEMRFWTIEHVKLNKRKSFKKQLLGTESIILSWNCWCIFYSAEQKIQTRKKNPKTSSLVSPASAAEFFNTNTTWEAPYRAQMLTKDHQIWVIQEMGGQRHHQGGAGKKDMLGMLHLWLLNTILIMLILFPFYRRRNRDQEKLSICLRLLSL